MIFVCIQPLQCLVLAHLKLGGGEHAAVVPLKFRLGLIDDNGHEAPSFQSRVVDVLGAYSRLVYCSDSSKHTMHESVIITNDHIDLERARVGGGSAVRFVDSCVAFPPDDGIFRYSCSRPI